ncbi:ABC transporter substrate-binding protein [Caenimonas koreensis]
MQRSGDKQSSFKTSRKWTPVFLLCALMFTAAPQAFAQILIGQTAGFTGPVAAGVKETLDGAKLYIDKVNQSGGIRGKTIELVSLDDSFDPNKAAENGRVLIEERGVVALFLTRGTPHTEAIIPLLNKHKVPLVAPSTGAMVLHEPVQRHVFNVRSTYQREAQKAVEQLTSIGMQRVAIVHADDSFGRDALEGANKGFESARLKPVVVIKADRSKPDFGAIVSGIVESGAQAVLWFASGNSVADGIHKLRAAGSSARVITLSNNASSGFIKSLAGNSQGVMVTQVFPYERSMSTRFVVEALALSHSKGLEVSPAMLEGFAAAKVLVEALQRAAPRHTRERIQAALESMKKFDLGGMDLSFSATDHTGLNFVDLSIIGDHGKFRR